MHRILIALAAVAAVCAGDAWVPCPRIAFYPDGRIVAGGVTAELQHYDAGWKSTSPGRAVAERGRVHDGQWRMNGMWQLPAGGARLTYGAAKAGQDAVQVDARLEDAGPTNVFALTLALDGALYRTGELRIDGQQVALPVESKQPQVRATGPARLVAVPLPTGGWLEVSGDLQVMVQDNRSWKSDTFSIRVLASPERAISARLRVRDALVAPLALGPAATIPRADEVSGDRTGGWSDQGDNDLRMLKAGRILAGGLPFEIEARSMVLTDNRIPGWPTRAEIPAQGRNGACLYILHAAAWCPKTETVVGRVTLNYADGSSEIREVKSQRDIADWWNPVERIGNAMLGWAGDNPHAHVGLYVSRFPIPGRPLASISCAAAGGAVWMVAGLALGEDVPLPAQAPEILAEDARWRPVGAPITWDVEPGSALDLSSLNAGPVPGRLVMRGPHLVLESQPDRPVRLLGANLCFTANYMDKQTADRLAKAFRRMGYNSVRLHHMDGGMVKPGGDGTELDPVKMDQLDYLVAACKREGLWMTTDLYISRTLPKGALPEFPNREIRQEFKALIPLLPSALENWKRFSTNLLTHRNPYTGLTWAEDPVLATLSLVNEDNYPDAAKRDPEVQAMIEKRFDEWLAKQTEPERSVVRDQARGRWMWRLQTAAYLEMQKHVRSLGVVAPTTGANMQHDLWTMALRDCFDFVDNHMYHDHPRFPQQNWRLPFAFNQRSAVMDMLRVPGLIAATRRLDRPFTVTELNYCLPNHTRAEYAAGAAAVAGIQDWSGVWRFAFAHDIKQITTDVPATGFDLSRDPIAQFGERAMALLYRRGDVRAAPWSAVLGYRAESSAAWIGAQLPAPVAALALTARVGVLPASTLTQPPSDVRCVLEMERAGQVDTGDRPVLACDDALAGTLAGSGLVKAADFDPAARRVRSADGQLDLDAAAGRLVVVGTRSVAAVLPGAASASAGGQVAAGPVSFANLDRDPATVVLAAIDEGDLATSKHLLLMHLTDAQNTGIRFGDRKHQLVEDWGKTPMLIRAGQVGVTIPGGRTLKAWALDLQGVRREEVALTPAEGGALRLDASVVRAWGPCLAWELAER